MPSQKQGCFLAVNLNQSPSCGPPRMQRNKCVIIDTIDASFIANLNNLGPVFHRDNLAALHLRGRRRLYFQYPSHFCGAFKAVKYRRNVYHESIDSTNYFGAQAFCLLTNLLAYAYISPTPRRSPMTAFAMSCMLFWSGRWRFSKPATSTDGKPLRCAKSTPARLWKH